MLKRDVTMVLASRALRNFPLGYLSVIVPIYLASTHSAILLGSFFSVSIVSSFVLLGVMSLVGHRIKMRWLLAFQVFAFAITLAIMSSTSLPILLLVAAAISLTNWAPGGGSGTGVGPYNTSLNIVLTDKTERRSRTMIFAISSIIGTISFALGAYFLSYSNLLAFSFDLPDMRQVSLSLSSSQSLFAFGAVLEVAAVVVVLLVSGRSIGGPGQVIDNEDKATPLLSLIKSVKSFISAEFVNGLGQGIFQRLVPLWFFLRFAISVEDVGKITAAAGAITALLVILSPRLERRFGSTTSIFLSRGASALLTAAIALSPSLPVALVVYYLSLISSRVGVPIQQSFVFASVHQRDWARASGTIAMAYSIGTTAGPIIGAFLILDVNLALPFILGAPFLLVSAVIYKRNFKERERGLGPEKDGVEGMLAE